MRYAYLIPPLEMGGPVVELLVADGKVRPLRRVAFVRGDPTYHTAHRIVRAIMRGF